MEEVDNEDTDTWIQLAAATANAVRFLTKEHKKPENEERPADPNNGDRPKKHPDEQRKYVEHRLRELRAWERKLSGKR